MNILAIDIGTYSIKFLDAKIDRKVVIISSHEEIVIDSVKHQYPDFPSLQTLQHEIIKNYLNDKAQDKKIIFQLPHEILTTRYLELPIANIKKAEMMIPFQLEDRLTFSVSTAHYMFTTEKQEDSTLALVNITKDKTFNQIYSSLQSREILPDILTSEIYLYQSFIKNIRQSGAFCILDLGHNTTNAYFVLHKRIVSNHTSHIAGKRITAAISQSYNIPMSEAMDYKHKNCFFLTDAELDKIDTNQQEFAQLMHHTIKPLLEEFQIWDLGFKTKYGQPIEHIYITGGSSNITNIKNYLQKNLQNRVEFLNSTFPSINNVSNFKESTNRVFNAAHLITSSQLSTEKLPNFLKGLYSSRPTDDISVHSAIFTGSRIFIIALFILISLIIEQTILTNDESRINRTLGNLVKSNNDVLKISNRDLRALKRKPISNRNFVSIKKVIQTKKNNLDKEIETLNTTRNQNTLKSLHHLGQIIPSDPKIDLITFKSQDGIVSGKFSSASSKKLESIANKLKSANLSNAEVTYNAGDKVLSFKFDGNSL